MTAPAFPQSDRADLIRALVTADLPPLAARAGVLIALYANSETGAAWPGFDRMADELGANKRTVRRMVRDHLEGRFFRVERPETHGRGRAATFYPIKQRGPARPLSENEKGAGRRPKRGPGDAEKEGHPAPPIVEGTADASADARERGNSNSKRNAKPSKPRAWHGPDSCSAGGGKRGGFSLADAALEYIRDAGE